MFTWQTCALHPPDAIFTIKILREITYITHTFYTLVHCGVLEIQHQYQDSNQQFTKINRSSRCKAIRYIYNSMNLYNLIYFYTLATYMALTASAKSWYVKCEQTWLMHASRVKNIFLEEQAMMMISICVGRSSSSSTCRTRGISVTTRTAYVYTRIYMCT